jgi:hypothetical protein
MLTEAAMTLEIGQPVRLGEWLVSRSLISRSDLFLALNFAQQRRCRLGDALVVMGLLERDRVEQETIQLMAAIAPKRKTRPTPPPLPAHAFRARKTPPPIPAPPQRPAGTRGLEIPAGGARSKRNTPPPLPASMRPIRNTPPPIPASMRTPRVTPPPIPADAGPRNSDGEQVFLLTRRKAPEE